MGPPCLLERLPGDILNHIFSKLDPAEILTTLCSVACVSRFFRLFVKGDLCLLAIDLSAYSHSSIAFPYRNWKIKRITFDFIVSEFSDTPFLSFPRKIKQILSFLGPHVEELVLLNYPAPSKHVLLGYIGSACPNLRVLKLEVSVLMGQFKTFKYNLQCLLESCRRIESLCVKVRGVKFNEDGFMLPGIHNLRPTSIKALKLEPAGASDTLVFLRSVYASVAPMPIRETLTCVSLVLDNITNAIILSISKTLPLLTELDLKDRPASKSSDDLSDKGFQSIIGCKHLVSLSLRRSRKNENYHIYFNLVTDVGMFLLAEGCKQLEYVRLGGFNKVTDAGYARVLNACLILKKFEIRHGLLLEDLAFQDLSTVRRSSFHEVKLMSCFITSEAVCELATCSRSMKVLDLGGCPRLSDSALSSISCLASLTYLNLESTHVTDAGRAFLGKGKAPISHLSLRYCGRVTDKGIRLLVGSEGKLIKTLTSLDLGYMDGVTDYAITTIFDACSELAELSIRNCKNVTNTSFLASKVRRGESKLLRKLDMYGCSALSIELFKLLKKPFFCGLQWIGIGLTHVQSVRDDQLAQILNGRRVLTICKHGCKMGCRSKWNEHRRLL